MNDIPEKTEEEQQFHAQMLAECYDILLNCNCYPLLTGGALLGAYRDGDMIPWSMGAALNVESRVAMKNENEIIKRLLNKKFEIIRHFRKEAKWKIRVDKIKFNIEIIGYYRKGDVFERNTGKRLKIIPARFFDEHRKFINLRNKTYMCPGDIEGYLTHLYGDWKTRIKSLKASEYRLGEHAKKI